MSTWLSEIRLRKRETNANAMITNGMIEMNRLNAISIPLRMPSIWKKRRMMAAGMLIPRIALLVAIYPSFYLMVRNHDVLTLLTANAVLGGLSALSSGVALICLTESLRKEVRSLVFAGVYSTAVAIFGGTTQLVITWLIR